MVSWRSINSHSAVIRLPTFAFAALAIGCYAGLADHPDQLGGADNADDDGGSGAGDSGTGGDTAADPPADAALITASGVRRLTAREYTDTVRDLLLDESFDGVSLLPLDAPTPFDNDYRIQSASDGLINGTEFLATQVSERLLADPDRLNAVVGCVASGPDDEACMRGFVTRFGRRALRRPLTPAEIDVRLYGVTGSDGALAHAAEAGDFAVGVGTLIQGFLQDPEFLYRVEIGTPVPGEPGVFQLSQFEIATRLSYLVWGNTPDDALLDRAAAGELADGEAIRAVAQDMLADPRAVSRVARFHAMWLGYENLPHGGELSSAMQTETTALVQRVVFDEQLPWHDLFRFKETFVSDLLAEQYGLPAPGSSEPVWVDYGDTGRAGLLSHGSFLSNGLNGFDTSPVQRGKLISELLLCQTVPPPPPGVGDDQPTPENTFCKVDRYAVHSTPGCLSCHVALDPVGFGLENYDALGRYRDYEPDNPDTEEDETQCLIEGKGVLPSGETFHGPAELAELAINSGQLSSCITKQLVRFATGHSELDSVDEDVRRHLLEQVGSGDFRFDDLVLGLASDDAFRYRREETVEEGDQ